MLTETEGVLRLIARVAEARTPGDGPPRLLTIAEGATETGLSPTAFWAAARALRRARRVRITIHPHGELGLVPTGRPAG